MPGKVLPTLWRVVYWTSQFLTWIVLPIMQSYCMAGDFSVLGKLRSAIIDNLIYYGSFAAIFVVLLVYVGLHRTISMEYLKVVGITASNTWGLILLIILLGYGLVELPRSYLEASNQKGMLDRLYFKVSKLSTEKCEAEDKLEDALEEVHHAYDAIISTQSRFMPYIDIILSKCPDDWVNTLLNRYQNPQQENRNRGSGGVAYNEKTLVKLHQNVIRSSQAHHRTKVQWDVLIQTVVDWEDVSKNEVNPSRYFKKTFPPGPPAKTTMGVMKEALYTPRTEWYWKCIIRSKYYRCLGYFLAVLTCMVVWSELTFSITFKTFSIYALLIEFASESGSYFFMEVIE